MSCGFLAKDKWYQKGEIANRSFPGPSRNEAIEKISINPINVVKFYFLTKCPHGKKLRTPGFLP